MLIPTNLPTNLIANNILIYILHTLHFPPLAMPPLPHYYSFMHIKYPSNIALNYKMDKGKLNKLTKVVVLRILYKRCMPLKTFLKCVQTKFHPTEYFLKHTKRPSFGSPSLRIQAAPVFLCPDP